MNPAMMLAALGTAALRLAAASDLMTKSQRMWLVRQAHKHPEEAPPAAEDWPSMTAAQSTLLFEAEEEFYRRYFESHQAWNQYANPHYPTKTDRSHVLKWDELGDSAAWSGHQLAALAHRYNVTRDSQTLARINTALGAFENLTQVSGKPGFMARFMGLAADPAYQAYYCDYGGAANCSAAHGVAWFRGGRRYAGWVFLDSLSRDAYFGAALGLVSVLRRVDDEPTHVRVVAILRLMAAALHADKWWIISPHVGQTKKVVPVNPVPSFIALWMKIALTVDAERYKASIPAFKLDAMVDLAVHTDWILQGAGGADHSKSGTSKYSEPYFGANLCIISITAMLMLMGEGDAHAGAVHAALGRIAAAGHDHLSASLSSHFLAASTAATRAGPAGQKQADMLQATLLDFAGGGLGMKWDRHADLRNRTALEPFCVDRANASSPGGVTCGTVAASSPRCGAKCNAVSAIVPSERVPTDYQWQRSPVQLVSGNDETAHEFSAIDVMLPYWMGRAAGSIPAPAARPPSTLAFKSDDCPCDDPQLCRPLSAAPKPQDEVIAFPAWEIYGAGYNESEYALYDWSKITTIAPFEPLDVAGPPSAKKRAAQQLYCTAHKHGVKVLQWSENSWNGTNCGAADFYGWCRSGDPRIFNDSAVAAWASSTAACIDSQGFDGVLLDAEGAYTVGKPKVKAAVTKAVCALKAALHKVLPDAVLYWTADTGPYFDYATLTKDGCVDLWLDMDYCRCSPTNRGGNAALSSVDAITKTYKNYGVDASHLGIIFPWFGCDFVCLDSGCEGVVKKPHSERILPHDSNSGNTPHGGDGCGVGVDAGPGYAEVLQLLPNATTRPTIDPQTYTKQFAWRNGSGGLHQVWYDDPVTLEKKYKAAKANQLKAVGMWTSDATMFNREAAAAMWKAVPTPKKSWRAAAAADVLN